MKKKTENDDELRPKYELKTLLKGGVRGKYAERYRAGTNQDVEKMNEFYRAKFNELFLEFNRYILDHPEFTEKFPPGAEVILLGGRDPGYNRFMLKNAPKEPQAAVFVDVGELAPVKSRLKHPKVIARPPVAV